MNATVERSMTAQLDAALDVLARRREQLTAEGPSTARAMGLARLYEREARVWQTLFEHARSRVQWRAALAAEAYARGCARYWRRQAEHAPEQPSAGLLLVCGTCQRRYEPTGEDLTAGRAACPDPGCGGWMFVAELAEPATGRTSRKAG